MVGLDYLNIHHEISQYATSVIYDRAGTGWSDHVKLPRSALDVTDELRNVLHAAGVPAPYLFVGHSLDRKSTRLNSSHVAISYAVFCLKKKKQRHICDGSSNEYKRS